VIPTAHIEKVFEGPVGGSATVDFTIKLRRTAGMSYGDIYLTSLYSYIKDKFLETGSTVVITPNQTMVTKQGLSRSGTRISGFTTMLVKHTLETMQLVINGRHYGSVITNNSNSILVEPLNFSHVSRPGNDSVEAFFAGSLSFAQNPEDQFEPVLSIDPLLFDENEEILVYVKGSQDILADIEAYSDQNISVAYTTYIGA